MCWWRGRVAITPQTLTTHVFFVHDYRHCERLATRVFNVYVEFNQIIGVSNELWVGECEVSAVSRLHVALPVLQTKRQRFTFSLHTFLKYFPLKTKQKAI